MTSDNRPPTLVAFLVGDSVGFIPKPWPRDRFKEALVDTLEAFGEPWVICECQQNDDGQDWLTVTKIAMEARSEYIEMKCTKPESSCTQENAQLKHSILEKAKAEDVNDTFCLLGITEENILTVLSNERGLPDQFNQLPDELKKKGFHGVHDTMLFLEEKISKTMVTSPNLNEIAGRTFKMKVPTLVIVVEGDLETISHVAEAVKKDIPVLLVRGSGMAADLIGYCMEEEGAIETRAPLLFGICFSKENFESLVTNIKTIVKHKSKVTEFNILTDSVTSLKDKVTESIIRVWALAHVKGEDTAADFGYNPTNQTADVDDVPAAAQYNLPKQHNGVPRRTSKIVPISDKAVRPKSTESNRKVTSNKDMKPSPIARYMLYQILQSPQHLLGCLKHETLLSLKLGKSLLAYALKEDLGDIVELLIDKGIKLEWADAERPSKETHLDEERKSPYEDGKSLYEEMYRERKRCQTNQARACIADIIELPEAQGLREKTGAWQIGCSVISYTIGTDAESKETNIMTPSDLLLWAVLNNNMKMAEIFWKRSHEPILTALIACTILRKMSRKAHHLKEREMEDKMLLHSRVFRQRAIDVTQRLYETNDQEAIFTLELENKTPVWGIRENALEFSQAHNIYDFVAHHVPQRSFDKIFYGGDFFHDNDLQNPKPSKKMRTCWKFRFYDVLTFFKALVASPISKFAIHYIFFSLFLVCLSAFVMTNITSEKWPINEKTVYEYCSYVWLFADILEEYVPPAVYMLMEHFHSSQWKRRAWNHMNNFWNAMDFLSYVVLVTGIFVRFLYETTDFGISRRFFTIGLFLMYMRFLHVLLIRRKIGPTIIMLKEGLKELMRFFVIMAVFIISAGVFYHANLYPNHYDMFSTFGVRYWSVWKVIYLPYWSVYGEFKDEIEGNDSTDNCSYNQTVYMNDPDIVRCPEKDWMVSLMSGFFVLILNLLLVNLIIAMFSFRFEEINKNSDQFWRFHRSQVILEFRRRIPVPLNLLLRPIAILWFCITKSEREQQNEADVEARAKLDKKQQILARRWVLSESDAQMFFDK
ncbi:transient receptor potential cation channel subfamily M member 1-like [Pecten maximus]|uniref:transient receptor potential cation channel subfamily M member 1-like n=1 Tax=Pecten maximus TaxID=6579 RepID=UPI00145841B5|nr:transient receptor potential cation channel subfamily M member 1-like [Pecten maximus]